MHPLLVLALIAIAIVIFTSTSCGKGHRHHHRPQNTETAGYNSPYKGQCLTNYFINQSMYGDAMATKIADACMLYNNPEEDPCKCADVFEQTRAAGLNINDVVSNFEQCDSHNIHGCTDPTPSGCGVTVFSPKCTGCNKMGHTCRVNKA